MARSIYIAAQKGLRVPIVYNTNAYDSVEVLKLLANVVDIYLPDLKYASDDAGYLYRKLGGTRNIHARHWLRCIARPATNWCLMSRDFCDVDS